MPAATAAAEPAELPPGVWPGRRGLRVDAGSKEAKGEVWVLPSSVAPGVERRAVSGGQRARFENVFGAERQAEQRAAGGLRVGQDGGPGEHVRVGFGDAAQAGSDQFPRAALAGFE